MQPVASVTLEPSSWSSLLNSLPVSVFRTDEQGTILYASPEWETLCGVPVEDMLARPLIPLKAASFGYSWEALCRQLKEQGGRCQDLLIPLVGMSEGFTWGLLDAQLEADALGTVAGMVGVVRPRPVSQNLSASNPLQEQRDTVCFRHSDCHIVSTLLDASHDAIALLDRVGRLIELNQSMARRLGRPRRILRGECLWDKLSPATRDYRKAAVLQVFDSGLACHVHEHSGKRFYSHALYPVFADDEKTVVQVALFSRDITEQILKERQIERYVREIERSNRDLEAFAHAASHDLREPLRMIGSFVDLLEQKQKPYLENDSRDYLGFIRDGVRRLDVLVRDLLDYARIGSQNIDRQHLALGDVVRQVWLDLSIPTRDQQAQLFIDQDIPSALGFPVLIERLLSNLINNALYYRHAERPPELRFGWSDSHRAWFLQDNGVGIDPAYHQKIFELFQRVNSGWQSDNSGLGLAICLRVVERHGGKLWVESQEGEGATFYFTLGEAVLIAENGNSAG